MNLMNIDNLKCPRCCVNLKVVDKDTAEDEYNYYFFRCPNCGFEIECREPLGEEQSEFDFYKDGQPIDARHVGPDLDNHYCLNCGHEVFVVENNMLSDIAPNITDETDDKMSFNLAQCEYCGLRETRWALVLANTTIAEDRQNLPGCWIRIS